MPRWSYIAVIAASLGLVGHGIEPGTPTPARVETPMVAVAGTQNVEAATTTTSSVARMGMPPGLSGPPQPGTPKNTPIEVYVDREGWQSGVGYKGMVHYAERLSNHLSKSIPGYVVGIAGGKKGILLIVSFKAQRNFYLAQENTKEFLSAIVDDLSQRLPEPVAPLVTVKQNGKEIIRAERVGKEVKVQFLL